MRALAEAGDAEAQNNLGLMYFNGRGVAQDDAEAVAWYRFFGPPSRASLTRSTTSMGQVRRAPQTAVSLLTRGACSSVMGWQQESRQAAYRRLGVMLRHRHKASSTG